MVECVKAWVNFVFQLDFLITLSLEGGHYTKVDKCHETHKKSNFGRSHEVMESHDTSILSVFKSFLVSNAN